MKKRGRESRDEPVPSGFRNAESITDAAKLAALKQQLLLHSDRYSECVVREARLNKNSILVKLMGDGVTYCLNKRDYHNSNKVYMLIRRSKGVNAYESVMRCYCKCAVTRAGELLRIADGRVRVGGPCSEFESAPRTVSQSRVALLSPLRRRRRRARRSRTHSVAT